MRDPAATRAAPAGGTPRRARSRLRHAAAAGALVVVAAATVVGVAYRRQLVSYVTHTKGSPTHTSAYVPFRPPPPFHLAAVGDVGESGARLEATAAAMAGIGAVTPYDAVLLLGDNVYPAGDPDRLEETVFGPFRPAVGAEGELLAILGNHDVKQGNAAGQVEALGMEGRFWARRFGDVLLVGLDSNEPGDEAQLAWLDQTLASTDAPWRIVALHHPPYSAGYQGSDLRARRAFTPLFERHGVQLVLSGHEHDYQRSVPIDGVTYVVSGAGARTRRTGEAGFTAVSFSWHHFLDIGVFADELVLRAVNQDGRVADDVTIPRVPVG